MMMRNVRYKRLLLVLASIGLIAMWFLVASSQPLASGYDREAAEDYADQWTCNDCQEPHNNYYRYYEGADCTNYASQVLHAGGYPYREGPNDIWHWWYKRWPWKHNSATWSNTPSTNEYFSQYQGNEFVYKGWPTQLDKGDIFLFDFPPTDGIPDHAAVIVGDGGGLKDQHTPPRKQVPWNFNEAPGTAYWSVHVVW